MDYITRINVSDSRALCRPCCLACLPVCFDVQEFDMACASSGGPAFFSAAQMASTRVTSGGCWWDCGRRCVACWTGCRIPFGDVSPAVAITFSAARGGV